MTAALAVPATTASLASLYSAKPVFDEEQALRLGDICARSGNFSGHGATSSEFFAFKILLGAEMGLSPLQAVVSLRMERGKPTLDATLIRARMLACGYTYEFLEMSDDAAIMRVSRGARILHPDVSFTKADAQKAGLMGKDNYKNYLQDMLVARVTSRAARRHAPDAFGGAIYVPGEIDADGAETIVATGAPAAAIAVAEAAAPATTASWGLDENERQLMLEAMDMARRLEIPRADFGARLRQLSGADADRPSGAAIARMHAFLSNKLMGMPPKAVDSTPAADPAPVQPSGAPKTAAESPVVADAQNAAPAPVQAPQPAPTAQRPSAPPAASRAQKPPKDAHRPVPADRAASTERAPGSGPSVSFDEYPPVRTLPDLAKLAKELRISVEDVGARLRALSGPDVPVPPQEAIDALYAELELARAAMQKGGAAEATPPGEPIPSPRVRR